MKKIAGTAVVFLILFFCTDVFGEEFNRFGIGVNFAYQDFAPDAFGDVDFKLDRTPLESITLTYHLFKQFSLELCGAYNKSDMMLEYDDKEGELGELEQKSVFLTGRFRFLINRTHSYIHIGAGGGYYSNEFTMKERPERSDFFALNQTAESHDSFGVHFLAGAEIYITPHYAVTLEIKSLFNQAEFDVTYLDETTETKDVALNAAIYSLGFKYYF